MENERKIFFFFQVLARLWWLLHLLNLFLFYFGLIGFIFLVLSDGSIKSAYYLWAIFFFSLKSHFLCGVSTCQADWCILIVDRLNFSFLITAVFSVLSLGFFLKFNLNVLVLWSNYRLPFMKSLLTFIIVMLYLRWFLIGWKCKNLYTDHTGKLNSFLWGKVYIFHILFIYWMHAYCSVLHKYYDMQEQPLL